MTVTYQVGGGGHLDIDFWVRYPQVKPDLILCLSSRTIAGRPRRPRPRKANTTIYRNIINYRGKGWTTRTLLLKPNERRYRQDGQVCHSSNIIFLDQTKSIVMN